MEKLYTLLTDGNGRYALKLDNEFLYKTDELDDSKYSRVVDQRKSVELTQISKIKQFTTKWVEELQSR